MSEGFFTIEVDTYGFMLDSYWCYIALSWELLIIGGVIATALVVFKKWNKRK
jgi:hypothetical protein